LRDFAIGLEEKLMIYKKKVLRLSAENEKIKSKIDEESNINNLIFDRTRELERTLKRKEEMVLEKEMKVIYF
jgi:hypothetical protein